jgi:hypothetical protein
LNREIEIDRFEAKAKDGTIYEIIAYQAMIDAGTDKIPGMKKLVTSDGLAVNYIDDQTFKIVATNEIVHKI